MRAIERGTQLANSLSPKLHEVVFRAARRFQPIRTVLLATDSVTSVLVVTNRPWQLAHVVASYDAQQVPKELILVTNSDDFDFDELDRLADRPDVTWLRTEPRLTLGAALNQAVAAASGQVLAKFDDDDYYSDTYLVEALAAMKRTGAGVVGKKTYFVYLEELDRTILVYPGNQNKRVGRVAGGTIVAHRDVFDHVTFPDRNLGEDVLFVRRAERAGYGVYSPQPQGFLQHRAATGHTWQFGVDELLRVSTPVGLGRDPELWSS